MPITMALFLVATGSYLILSFISVFGDQAIAGYGAAVRFEHLFSLPVIGLNTAVISIAGQNFGARRFDRIKEVYFLAIFNRIYNYVLVRHFNFYFCRNNYKYFFLQI